MRWTIIMPCAAAACALVGCAGSQSADENPAVALPAVEASESDTAAASPESPASTPDVRYGPVPTVATDAGLTDTSAEEAADAAADAGGDVVPSTGRPRWWFEEIRIEDGRMTLCSEVLGATLLEVKRSSMDAARDRMLGQLGLETGAAIPGERIERVWATPLPTAKAGSVRYAGYVMLSCDAPG